MGETRPPKTKRITPGAQPTTNHHRHLSYGTELERAAPR
eukprot:CAMPEP_0173424368 /NCGR_PEP_ID=MMETSP1357-20121228/4296_1 /TAXON_ID=77926 /ORGANISM="Hemiselmis rufescens, Strain PCC563" /LENGTH=38 /DNA_ID= /DNA_START= /DNA_END= /DNA_ORIENTATION=